MVRARRFAGPRWWKLLYNHNPFYVISVMFVLLGVHTSFTGSVDTTDGWLMMSIYCGYMLLLGLVAWVVVFCGRVWEDARTVLLSIVLLLVALSNSFDNLVIQHVDVGARYLVGGLVFAVLLTESLILALRLRLSVLFRTAYYAQMAVLFLYPIWLAHLLDTHQQARLAWFVLGFPVVAAAALLLLLPALHAGSRDRRPTGTPWRWPWYPLPLFVFIGVGMTLRSYSLSLSFEVGGGMGSGFMPYFLVPILLAVVAVVLEFGRIQKRPSVVGWATAAPLASLLLAFPSGGGSELQRRFVDMLLDAGAAPAKVTIVAVCIFYMIACLRNIPRAEAGLVASLLVATFIGGATVGPSTLVAPQQWPLALLSAWFLVLGILRQSTARVLAGSAVAMIVFQRTGQGIDVGRDFAFYLLLACYAIVLAVPLLMNDRLAKSLRRAAPYVAVTVSAGAAMAFPFVLVETSPAEQIAGILLFALFPLLYWLRYRRLDDLVAALSGMGAVLLASALHGYRFLRLVVALRGLGLLGWGLIFLAIALAISLSKGGLHVRLRRYLRLLNRSIDSA